MQGFSLCLAGDRGGKGRGKAELLFAQLVIRCPVAQNSGLSNFNLLTPQAPQGLMYFEQSSGGLQRQFTSGSPQR